MNETEIKYKSLAVELTKLVSFTPTSKDELKEWYDRAEILKESGLLTDVPHSVWHYFSDADIRFKDDEYAALQNEKINSLIDDLNRGVMPPDDSKPLEINFMNILKSILAVLAGIIFIVITHTVTDLIVEGLGIFPPPAEGLHITWMVVVALTYRVLWSVAGSYLTSWLAPSRPMAHSVALGIIGTILGTIGAIVAIPMNLSPAWYPIALAVFALPAAWLGGTIYKAVRNEA